MWNESTGNAERRVLSLVPNNSELRTYNSELGAAVDSKLGAAVDSELGEAGDFGLAEARSIAVENDHPDGPYHSNSQPYHHDLTE